MTLCQLAARLRAGSCLQTPAENFDPVATFKSDHCGIVREYFGRQESRPFMRRFAW
jgi:hypothetical protein